MACWHWLVLLWQLSWFHMAESGFTSFKRYGRPGWNNVAIPANGIYIVGVTADSSYGSRPPAHIRVSLWIRHNFCWVISSLTPRTSLVTLKWPFP